MGKILSIWRGQAEQRWRQKVIELAGELRGFSDKLHKVEHYDLNDLLNAATELRALTQRLMGLIEESYEYD